MNVQKIKALADWSALASKLSGHDCNVRFETPPDDNRWLLGLTIKMRGKPVIMVSPDRVDDDDFLRVLLHETAHARLHLDSMHNWQSMAQYTKNLERLHYARFDAPAPTKNTSARSNDETEAEKLTAEWLNFCRGVDGIKAKTVMLIAMAKALDYSLKQG